MIEEKVLMRVVVVRWCESEYCVRKVCLKECWFVSVEFSRDVAAPPRKRGWGRILFFPALPLRAAGTHAPLELAVSPASESITIVSGRADSPQIRGGTRCAREGEEGGEGSGERRLRLRRHASPRDLTP